MLRGGVWIIGWARYWDAMTQEWHDGQECYICNQCKLVNGSKAMACPRCGQTMVGVADGTGVVMPIENAVINLGEDEIEIE